MSLIKNFYAIVPKSKKVHNPGYDKHGLDIPFYMLIIGGSGSGKTNVLMQIMQCSTKTFHRIIICVKNSDEPLYNLLLEKCPEVEFYESGHIPDIDEFDSSEQSLLVFDDLVLEKDQSAISEYFIRGRKLNITCIYISQSYYKVPKLIRINCRYIILKKLSSKKDLKLILNEYNITNNIDEVLDLYNKITAKDFTNFMLIDTRDNKFRENFLM